MNKERIAFIVEGDVREMDIFENVKKNFFDSSKVDVISFPAGENIYMLWKRLKEDAFQTDVIELVRERDAKAAEIIKDYTRDSFSEIYLFFDYDRHQNNLSKAEIDSDVIQEMIDTFNNETEYGLLYISYPMVEAVRDYSEDDCETDSGCVINLSETGNYKNISSRIASHNAIKEYTINEWQFIIDSYVQRVSCLMGREQVVSLEEYKRQVTERLIYDLQKQYEQQGKVFVLSAIPGFLLAYNRQPFWHRMVNHSHNKRKTCSILTS